MTCWIALLRAVNVGGTGKLPMADLKAMCAEAGFADIRTYIASGNVVFSAEGPEDRLRDALEQRLHAYAGKPVAVFLRSADELTEVLKANPFADHPGNKVTATFLDHDPPPGFAADAKNLTTEDLAAGPRVIFTHYPNGLGQSKLRLPAAEAGTARNMNTLTKLVEMAAQASRS